MLVFSALVWKNANVHDRPQLFGDDYVEKKLAYLVIFSLLGCSTHGESNVDISQNVSNSQYRSYEAFDFKSEPKQKKRSIKKQVTKAVGIGAGVTALGFAAVVLVTPVAFGLAAIANNHGR